MSITEDTLLARLAAFSYRWFPYLYLLVAAPFVLSLCVVEPPFEFPDEPQHFLRTVQVSAFDFGPHFRTGSNIAGAYLPKSVDEFVGRAEAPQIWEGFAPSVSARFALLTSGGSNEADSKKRSFIPFPSAMLYNPAYYAPQAFAIATARLFSPRVYVWFYAGRMTNAVAALLAVFLALLLSRDQQFLLAAIAILPMSLTQMASLSPDACLIGLTILFVSACLWLRRTGTRPAIWITAACAVWLVLGRPVLFPIAALPLISAPRIGRRTALVLCSGILVLSTVLYLAWSTQTRAVLPGAVSLWGSNPHAQIACILNQPLQFLHIVIGTLDEASSLLMQQLIGVLGWLTVYLPGWYYTFAALLVLVLLFVVFSWDRLVSWTGLLVIAAILLVVFATCVTCYLLFCRPCAPSIEGIQGRYFIPVLVFLVLLCRDELSRSRSICVAAFSLWIFFAAVTLPVTANTISRNYYQAATAFCAVLPGGSVDIPPSASTDSSLTVSGSVPSLATTDRISIFIDNSPRQVLHLDGQAVRWTTSVNLAQLSSGKHRIVVEATTRQGCKSDIGDTIINRQ